MSIVDQYGRGVSSRNFVNSSRRHTPDRPYIPVQLGDIDQLIPTHDRETLVSFSRKMFSNMGIARGAILQKAMYSIGSGWDITFTGVDKDWGKKVTKLLNEEWSKVCDIRGRNFDWKTLLYLDSVAIDRDGDFAIVLTESETGYPQMQRIGAHRIANAQGQGKVSKGKYKGLKIKNGVIRNKFGRPIAYQIIGDEFNDDRIIEASDIVFVFDPHWYEQERGIPAFSHCLDDMRDMLQSQQWEQSVMLMLSQLGMIEYNDTGYADTDDTEFNFDESQVPAEEQELYTKSVGGVMTRFMKAGSGNKLESIKMERPSDVWDRFNDRLARSALTGICWPYSMTWKATGQGTAERSDMQKAQRAVEDRQNIMRPYAHRIISWVVAKFIKQGRIEAPTEAGDWYAWGFTMPPRISIDFKNDTASLLKLYFAGKINDTDLLGYFGKTPEQAYRERAYEVATRKKIQREVATQTGEEIEDREMIMHTPNEQKEESNNEKNDDEL